MWSGLLKLWKYFLSTSSLLCFHKPWSRLELKKDHQIYPNRPTSFAAAGHVWRSTTWWSPCRAPLKRMSACTWFNSILYLEIQQEEQLQLETQQNRSFLGRLLQAALQSEHMFLNRRKGGILKWKVSKAEILASWKEKIHFARFCNLFWKMMFRKMDMT